MIRGLDCKMNVCVVVVRLLCRFVFALLAARVLAVIIATIVVHVRYTNAKAATGTTELKAKRKLGF